MWLLDLLKTKEAPKKMKVNKYQEIGGSGTEMINGFVSEEYNNDLAGLNGIRVYDKMRASDSTVFASLLAMELPIRATKWRIEPGTTLQKDGEKMVTEEDAKIANFLEDALFNRMSHTFDDFLRQALTMLPFGFSVFEKVYKVEDGAIYWEKFAQRLQKSIYSWETKDGQPGITQQLYTTSEAQDTNPSIPLEKLILFTYRKEGTNPEGRSVLRSSYKNWYIKDQLYKYDAVKFERQSIGIPVMTLPRAADEADKREAETILANIRSTSQSYVVLPNEDWKFEFADLKASSNADPKDAIAHHNREITKNILAQFLELWATQGGSYALSEDQSSLFLLSLTAIAKQIAETLNRVAIKELVDLNFDLAEGQTYPKLTFNKLGDVDYSKLASSIATLASGGLIEADDELESYLRDTMDLPKKVEKESDDNEVEQPKEKQEKDEKQKVEEDEKEEENFNDKTEALQFKENKKTLYVKRKVLNATELIKFAKDNGISDLLDGKDLHITTAYSKNEVDFNSLDPDTKDIVVDLENAKIEKLGDAIVIAFNNKALNDRWQYYKDKGASWDYPSYIAHISLSYNNSQDIPKDLTFTGKVELSKEYLEELNEDYLKDLGFNDSEEVQELAKAKRIFNIVDILNVQKYDK